MYISYDSPGSKSFFNGRNGEVGHCVNSLILRYGGPIFVKSMR